MANLDPLELAVRKTSVKLNVPEEDVRLCLMWSYKELHRSFTHPNRNNIFVPGLGSFDFKLHRGAYMWEHGQRALKRRQDLLETEENPRKVASLTSQIEGLKHILDVLLYKVGYTFKGKEYRNEVIERQCNSFYYNKYWPTILKLREERERRIKEKDPTYKKLIWRGAKR